MQSDLYFNQSPINDQIIVQDFEYSEYFSSNFIGSFGDIQDSKSPNIIQDHSQNTTGSKKIEKQVKKQKNIQKQRKRDRKRRNRKGRQYKSPDYRKNICGYVTKKALRQFIGSNYQKIVIQMCKSSNVDYESLKNYYSTKIQRVTGPSHIPELIDNKIPQYYSMNQIFYRFFKWFLQERYVRHLYLQGKMELKKEYIEYKNRELLPMLAQFERKKGNQLQQTDNFIQNAIQMHIQ